MFDLKIGINFAYSSFIIFVSLSLNPVVAITIGIIFSFAYFKILNVALGLEKSIITSGFSFIFSMLSYTGILLLHFILSYPAKAIKT